jgi:hypothetical protein
MADQNESPPVLSYATPVDNAMVLLASFGNASEAELHAAELGAEGIRTTVLNGNVNSLGMPYSGFSMVEMHVHPDDVTRARAVLALATSDDLEPLDDPGTTPVIDDEGQPLSLVQVAAFESVRMLRDAQTILASGHVRSHLPIMAPRGDRAPGEGKRFILRVGEDDLEKARRLLEAAEDEADEEDFRCPQCHAWRVIAVPQVWKSFVALICFTSAPEEQMECLACKHHGPKVDFLPTRNASQNQPR